MSGSLSRRVCIIGNSHTACIKLAADRTGSRDADFFAVSANRMNRLRLKGGVLRFAGGRALQQFRAVAGGQNTIDVKAYDTFAFVGIGFEYRDFLRAFRLHCLYRHREWRAGRDLVSDAGFREFQKVLYRFRPAYRLTREIRAVRPDATVAMVASPYPTTGFLENKYFQHLRSLADTPYFGALAELYETAAAAAARSVGAELILQGPETIAAPGFTRPQFNRRPIGLVPTALAGTEEAQWFREVPSAAGDPYHMNVDFGALRLADIVRHVRARTAAVAVS